MGNPMIGVSCSTAAALLWAPAIMLFKKSGEAMSPMALNLFECVATVILKEPLTSRRVSATVLAVAGAMVVAATVP
jgi:hypothetical protein